MNPDSADISARMGAAMRADGIRDDIRDGDDVLACIAYLAREHDRSSSPVILRAGLALDDKGRLPFHQIEPALDHIGMRGEPTRRRLNKFRPSDLPVLLRLDNEHTAVLLEMSTDRKECLVFSPDKPEAYWAQQGTLAARYSGEAVMVEPDPSLDRENERPWQKAVRTHWFWSEVWKVRHNVGYVALAAVIINLLALALPLFTMNVYDRIIPNKSVSSLWVLAVGVLLAFGLDFTLRLARGQLIDEVGRELDTRLSQKLFEKVMNLPLAQKQGSTGALARRVTDYESVRDFFASTTVVLAFDILFLFLFLVIIASLAGWLVVVPIIGMIVMALAGLSLQRAMARVSVDAQADSGLQSAVLVEAIGGQETIKAARAEGRMLARWRRYAQMSAGTQERLRRLTSISINLASLCQQTISISLVIGGFYQFTNGEMTMGAIIAIVMLAGRALAPVGQFAFLMARARQAFLTLESLQTLMEQDDERSNVTRSVVPEIRTGEIRFEDAGFRYPGASRDSLLGLNVAIKPGERIGIIGRVASGKSTFGRLLCGLYPPTDGSMFVDELDSRQYHPHELRGAFRYVGQDAELFSGTVRDNLLLGSTSADDARLIDAVQRSGADIFLARDASGFDLLVGERGNRLSGGQRSFLVLARALVEPCKLLFLDEPTGAMDTQTERWFIDHLATALNPEQTLVVSTHRHAMLGIVNRLIVIDGGKVIADGPRDQILASMSAAASASEAPAKGGKA